MLDVWFIAPEDLPIPPQRGGSVQIYLHSLLSHLAKFNNLSITLISPSSSNKEIKTIQNSPSYKNIIIPSKKENYLRAVTRLVHQCKPGIIQIENRPKFAYQIRSSHPSSKIILNLHSTTFLTPNHLSMIDEKRCNTSVDKIICNSHYLRRTLIHNQKLSFQKQKISVIHPGVDLQKFNQTSFPQLHNPVRLLYVGRIIRQKGVHVLLRALPLLKQANIPVELTIIGRTPPWEASYKQLIQSLSRNLPVKQKGFISPAELPKYYRSSDIFVCPSQHNEAFGLVNIEAMASGLPVIASDVGGIIETVTPKCGIIVKNHKNPFAFANAITNLVKVPDLWRQKSINAKQRSTLFSWENTANQFLELYQDM